MFFRIKKIKGKEYAYIVENEWGNEGSRQKVKGYIGRAYRFELVDDIDFLRFTKVANFAEYTENNNKNQIINDLIEWELFRFGVSKDDFSIDLKDLIIQKNKRDVALLINDGFLCGATLKKMFNFEAGNDEKTDGYQLARAFIEAGIKIPENIFIGIFGKIYK